MTKVKHTTNQILMVKPDNFFLNPETSVNNHFQSSLAHLGKTAEELNAIALEEFDNFSTELKNAGVKVHLWQSKLKGSPDAIFPNNWFIAQNQKHLHLMPMFAENRRKERDPRLIDFLNTLGYGEVTDHSFYERSGQYFEGTGSAVFHHSSKTAYVSISSRADRVASQKILESIGYKPCFFKSYQTVGGSRRLIYHTNVMLSVGEQFAVVCLDSIDDKEDRTKLLQSFKMNQLEIIEITEKQVESFCGNILQLKSQRDENLIAMSKRAISHFTKPQLKKLSSHGNLISSSLEVIETLGGGGARCMIAELL